MRFKLACDATSIHNDFVVVYGDKEPSTITKRIREFKGGSTNVDDNLRSGAPIIGLTEANIKSVRSKIDDNPYLKYDELDALTLLSRGSLERILVDFFKLRKVASRYKPHFLTQKKRVRTNS